MVVKLDLYKDIYTKEYWLIDPETRTTFVYGLFKKEGDLNGQITKCYAYTEDKVIQSIEFPDLIVKASELFEFD